MTDPPLPDRVLAKIAAFLAARASGQIVLHVVRGEIRGVDCNDMLRLQEKGRSS